jgi:hypothetical protein
MSPSSTQEGQPWLAGIEHEHEHEHEHEYEYEYEAVTRARLERVLVLFLCATGPSQCFS